eukprot:253047-Heterocapsa_arctica.AAC.1
MGEDGAAGNCSRCQSSRRSSASQPASQWQPPNMREQSRNILPPWLAGAGGRAPYFTSYLP